MFNAARAAWPALIGTAPLTISWRQDAMNAPNAGTREGEDESGSSIDPRSC